MGITTYDGRIQRALNMKNGNDLWVAVGRTTAWTNESSPPDEDPATTAIDEAIVYVQPGVISLAKTVASGEDVEVGGQKYAFVADGNAFTEEARYLYIKGVFDPDSNPGQPAANFRQHGLYSGLTPAAGHETEQWLAPADVSDAGLLEYYENHTVKSLGAGESREIHIVIEFR